MQFSSRKTFSAAQGRTDRGVSGALYLQSAIVGVMLHRGLSFAKLPLVSGVDVWVSRGETL